MKEFARILDGERMKEAFQAGLPSLADGARTITQCRPIRRWYRRNLRAAQKSSLSVCYEIQLQDRGRAGNPETKVLYAKAYLAGRSRQKLEEFRRWRLRDGPSGEPFVHLPELDAIVWEFPNDPRLPQLPTFTDPARLRAHLPYPGLPPGLSGPGDLLDLEAQVIRYRPEDRCTSRCSLAWEHGGRRREVSIFGKIYKDDRGRHLDAALGKLWTDLQSRPCGLDVPRPLGYQRKLRIHWQTALQGVRLLDVLNAENQGSLLARTGRGLARLHRSELPLPLELTLEARLRELRKRVRLLVKTFPPVAGPVTALLERLEREVGQLTPYSARPIHADFHLKQLLAEGDRVSLVDFDDLTLGDPFQDVADLLVDLHVHDFDPSLIDAMRRSFEGAYRSETGVPLAEDRVRWHMRLRVVKKIYRQVFKRAGGNSDEEVRSLLSLADRFG